MTRMKSIVLYAEDEENDALLMRLAFAKEGLAEVFHRVSNGQAAIDYLSGTGAYADREQHPEPGVMLLDLNMPEMDGFDVLKWIRAHPLHHELPVVVFSSSVREEDRARARVLGANDFVVKPNSGALFREVARKLKERWLDAGGVKAGDQ